jgi:two-component system, chemotaxis family, chemotaxis protein CheY
MARILVVEDSSAFRAFIRAALEGAPELFDPSVADVEVVEASSGFDALRLLPRGHYDLVITDINMPDINGLELVRFMRENERYRTVCTILISTQSAEKDRARGLALGANAFLAKPFTVEALHQAITANIGSRAAPRKNTVDTAQAMANDKGSPR